MSIVEVGALRFGEGRPKICVPLTGGGMPALLSEVQSIRDLSADLFEWRIDSFFGDPLSALPVLKAELPNKPLLCTVRTKPEGGSAELTPDEYEQLLESLLDCGGFELIDIELSCGDARAKRLTEKAHEKGVAVVMSRHDFSLTPPEDEICAALEKMSVLGADLPKMAVMPKNPQDVLTLLSSTLRAKEKIGCVVTMSMGALGKVSRVCGELFGSCMTFGAGLAASAPGQINAEDLSAVLEDLSPAK